MLRAQCNDRDAIEALLRSVQSSVRRYLSDAPRRRPPGAGAFASGARDTAARAEEILAESGFGRSR